MDAGCKDFEGLTRNNTLLRRDIDDLGEDLLFLVYTVPIKLGKKTDEASLHHTMHTSCIILIIDHHHNRNINGLPLLG